MIRLYLTFGLLYLTVHLFGQSENVTGSWRSPKSLSGVSYTFDSSGVVKYHWFTCMAEYNRSGHYFVSNDSIIIKYDTLTTEEKQIYHIKTNPQSGDTLFIVDRHKIKVSDFIFIYDQLMDQTFTLTDSVYIPGQFLRTNQVRFDIDQSTLRPESYLFLDSLAEFLLKNKNCTIEIAQHGDADAKHGTGLSQRRAEAIMDYLTNKGINRNRLSAKGYGNSKPIWSDYEIRKTKRKEEKERKKLINGRTEFLILRTDFTNN